MPIAMPKIGSKIRVTLDQSFLKSYLKVWCPDTIEYSGTVTEHGTGDLAGHFYLVPFPSRRIEAPVHIITMGDVLKIEVLNDDSSVKTATSYDPAETRKQTKTRTWNVTGSTGNIYQVKRDGMSGAMSCNCYAGLMNRKCRHVKRIEEILIEEQKEKAPN